MPNFRMQVASSSCEPEQQREGPGGQGQEPATSLDSAVEAADLFDVEIGRKSKGSMFLKIFLADAFNSIRI
jgi:hypothetical protein